MTDYTALSLEELKKLGFMRWGRMPIPNLWLVPAELFATCMPGTALYGIDGAEYRVGHQQIDTTALFGFLAYGVKVEEDTAGGGPEIPPEKLAELARQANGRKQKRYN